VSLFGIVYKRRHLQFALTDAYAYLLALEAGFLLARLWGGPSLHFWDVLRQYTGASIFMVSSTVLMLYLLDGYQRTYDYRRAYHHLRLWASVAGGQVLALIAYGVFPNGWWGPAVGLATGLSLAAMLSLTRFLLCQLNPNPVFPTRTVVVGTGRAAQLVARLAREDSDHGSAHQIIGFVTPPNGHPRRRASDHVDDDLPEGTPPLGPILCRMADLPQLVSEQRIDLIVVAVRGTPHGDLTRNLLECKTRGAAVEEMPTFYKRLAGKVPVLHVSDSWLVYGPVFVRKERLAAGLRRIADVTFSVVLGLPSIPVVALAALVIRLESAGSPIYVQERLGRNQKPFRMYKLRTMREDAEETTGAVWSGGASDPRVTRVGRFLRRSRIDELPQLFNVLRGDMSVVGPRPERDHFVCQLKEQIPFYALRFSVKPGLTGWAQVNYRYGCTIEDAIEKLRYELYEIQELTPALYLLILLKTVQTVLLRSGS
jgi:exopolysaccharide biosynthesis polyprenyl glycosylphosphotransferase